MVDPQYTFVPGKKRILIPKTITLVLLGIIFYLGVLLNLYLLNLQESVASLVKTVAVILIVLIVLLGFFINIKKAKKGYLFFPDQIAHGKDFIYYRQIVNVEKKRGFFDKLFHTYSLVLDKNFKVENIPESIDLVTYTNQMVAYSRSH